MDFASRIPIKNFLGYFPQFILENFIFCRQFPGDSKDKAYLFIGYLEYNMFYEPFISNDDGVLKPLHSFLQWVSVPYLIDIITSKRTASLDILTSNTRFLNILEEVADNIFQYYFNNQLSKDISEYLAAFSKYIKKKVYCLNCLKGNLFDIQEFGDQYEAVFIITICENNLIFVLYPNDYLSAINAVDRLKNSLKNSDFKIDKLPKDKSRPTSKHVESNKKTVLMNPDLSINEIYEKDLATIDRNSFKLSKDRTKKNNSKNQNCFDCQKSVTYNNSLKHRKNKNQFICRECFKKIYSNNTLYKNKDEKDSFYIQNTDESGSKFIKLNCCKRLFKASRVLCEKGRIIHECCPKNV